ncbi:MAG: hypothetical protein R3E12_13125 [Candidatus Eisenbacteria bacterium]
MTPIVLLLLLVAAGALYLTVTGQISFWFEWIRGVLDRAGTGGPCPLTCGHHEARFPCALLHELRAEELGSLLPDPRVESPGR